eukprot:g55806.t1
MSPPPSSSISTTMPCHKNGFFLVAELLAERLYVNSYIFQYIFQLNQARLTVLQTTIRRIRVTSSDVWTISWPCHKHRCAT